MKTIELSKEEEAGLLELERNGTHEERRRAQGILFLHRGQKQAEAARLLGVDERSVRRWVRRFRETGVLGMRRKKRSYEKPKMTDERERRLIEAVRQTPESLGMGGNQWSCPLLADWFSDTFDVQVSCERIRQVLLKHGLRFRRAKLSLTSPDPLYAEKKRRLTA